MRVRRRLVRSGMLAPVQRVRRQPAQLLRRVDVRPGGHRVRVRLSGRPHRQALRRGRTAVRRPVPGQAVVSVRVRRRTEYASVQRRARDQTIRRTRDRVLRQTRRGAQKVLVSLAVRRCTGTEDFRSRCVRVPEKPVKTSTVLQILVTGHGGFRKPVFGKPET